MKFLITLLLLIIITETTYSQNLNSSLSLQAGVSLPYADFASSDLSKGSFALMGFTGAGEFDFKMNDDLGLFLQSGIQFNPINVGELGFQKVKADPFLQDVYIRSDPFRFVHLLVGPEYFYSISDLFTLSAKLGAGIVMAYTPYQLYKPEYFMTGPPFFEITSSRDVSFAYSAGVHLDFKISSCYSLGINTQLIGSSAAFDFQTGSGIRTDKRFIGTWNTSLALTIIL